MLFCIMTIYSVVRIIYSVVRIINSFSLACFAESGIYINLISFINISGELLFQLLSISIISFLAMFFASFSSVSAIYVFYSFPRDTSLFLWYLTVMLLGVFQGCTSCCALLYTFLSVSGSKKEFPRLLILLKSVLQRSALDSVSLYCPPQSEANIL